MIITLMIIIIHEYLTCAMLKMDLIFYDLIPVSLCFTKMLIAQGVEEEETDSSLFNINI